MVRARKERVNGTFAELVPFNGINPTVAENLKFYDAWGSNETYPHYAVPWAWAFDTPFKWTKQIPSYLRRHAQRHGDLLAGAHHRQGRHSLAVPRM